MPRAKKTPEKQLPIEGMEPELETFNELEALIDEVEELDAALKFAKNKLENAKVSLMTAMAAKNLTLFKGEGRIVSLVPKSDAIKIAHVRKSDWSSS